jgi:hypothetical protein
MADFATKTGVSGTVVPNTVDTTPALTDRVPITGGKETSISNIVTAILADATTAANLGATVSAGGTGAVTRSVQDWMLDAISVMNFIPVAQHAAIRDGTTTDDHAAYIKAAIDAHRVIFFPAGTYNWAGGTTYYLVPANTILFGVGEKSVIQVTGSTITEKMFIPQNASNITFSKLKFVGNSQAAGNGDGVCIMVQCTSANITNIEISDCVFENFKGDGWVWLFNSSTDKSIDDVRIFNNIFRSRTGNSRNPTSTAVPCGCVWADSTNDTTAKITNLQIKRNTAIISHIKSFSLLWNGVENAVVENNVIVGPGTAAGQGFADDAACYAMACYGTSVNGTVFRNNVVLGVRDCGVYLANAPNTTIENLFVYGQTSTAGVTLPKGAVAINGARGASGAVLRNIYARDCVYGITCNTIVDGAGQTVGGLDLDGFFLENISSEALVLSFAKESTAAYSTYKYRIHNGKITGTSKGFIYNGTVDGGCEYLSINNLTISGCTQPMDFLNGASTIKLKNCDINNVIIHVSATNTALNINGWNNPDLRLIIRNIKFMGPYSTAVGYLVRLDNTLGIDIDGMHFYNFTNNGAYCIRTHGAQGSIRNVTWTNCQANTLFDANATALGDSIPSWSGSPGMVVQKLIPAEAGTTPNKYVIMSWLCITGTTWVPLRMTTGN